MTISSGTVGCEQVVHCTLIDNSVYPCVFDGNVQVTSVAERTAAPAVASPAAAAEDSNAQEIYLGFSKDDTAPREGRKGRVIKDDPSRYPAKEDLGPLTGATGWLPSQSAVGAGICGRCMSKECHCQW